MHPGPILRRICNLGYRVSIRRLTGGGVSLSGRELPVPEASVELHAVMAGDSTQVHIVRVEGDNEETVYRAAVELALLVGIEMQDG